MFDLHGYDFCVDLDEKMAESSNLELRSAEHICRSHASTLKGEDIARPPSYFRWINKAICSCTNGIQNVHVCAYRNFCTTSTNSTRNTLIVRTEMADCPERIRTAVNGPMRTNDFAEPMYVVIDMDKLDFHRIVWSTMLH